MNNKYKIIVIGDSNVGKTSIIDSYANDFNNNKIPKITIGTQFTETFISKYKFYLQIWDCAGQEKFRALTKLYYRHSTACILIFDLSNIDTLISLEQYWIKTVLDNTDTPPLFLLVGNKSDLNSTISKIDIMQLANKYNMTYIETSVINQSNIDTLFNTISEQIISNKFPIIQDFNIEFTVNLDKNTNNTYLNNLYSYC
jgi:small GTP-binding protein